MPLAQMGTYCRNRELVASGSDVTKAGWRVSAPLQTVLQACTGARLTMEPFPLPQIYDSVFLMRRQGTLLVMWVMRNLTRNGDSQNGTGNGSYNKKRPCLFVCFESQSLFVAHSGLKFQILLFQPPGCWDYRCGCHTIALWVLFRGGCY